MFDSRIMTGSFSVNTLLKVLVHRTRSPLYSFQEYNRVFYEYTPRLLSTNRYEISRVNIRLRDPDWKLNIYCL